MDSPAWALSPFTWGFYPRRWVSTGLSCKLFNRSYGGLKAILRPYRLADFFRTLRHRLIVHSLVNCCGQFLGGQPFT